MKIRRNRSAAWLSVVPKSWCWSFFLLLWCLLLPRAAWSQADTASIDGTVMDASGGVVPDAELTLRSEATGVQRKVTSSPAGLYSFPNLRSGDYTVQVRAEGFRLLERTGISLRPNQKARLDIQLELGAVTETVTVSAAVSSVNFENATQETAVGPNVLNQLPLVVGGSVRSVTTFALLIPGVNFGGTSNSPFDARVNGGLHAGDEAVLDGASMSEIGGNAGFINFQDFRITPDMVSEFKMITSSYEPQWGASTGSQIIATTRSGTDQYHGGLFEYHRNTSLNAAPWGRPRPKDIENDFGVFVGGPVPGINRGNFKTFGYFLYEGFRIRGGVQQPTLSIPSLKQRVGDFTDWTDSAGRLIPVYDPATSRTLPSGAIEREQFSCNGVPNVICPSRIANSLAHEWYKHLPTPTNDKATQNFVPPRARPSQTGQDFYLGKVDVYPNEANHVSVSYWHNRQPPNVVPFLPEILDRLVEASQFKNIIRGSWDHTFSPTLLNHFNFGYTRANFTEGSVGARYADQLPQIKGVQSHENPPTIFFTDGFASFTHPGGPIVSFINDISVWNNLTTWVKGKHTFKFGGEYWWITKESPQVSGRFGTFNFARPSTGVLAANSGSPIASFLLERAFTASSNFNTIDQTSARKDNFIAHFGDTWKMTPKLTFNLGIRWDMFRPLWEVNNQYSFFDPLKPNPLAAGRPGALAFAGDDRGGASFGARYPEHLFKTGFAPRLGLAYAVDPKTVVRMGWGIFYGQFYWVPFASAGFNANPTFTSSQGGLEPAMILSEGFPQNFAKPPFFESGLLNGQNPDYRDFNGNRLPYSQQWNLTIERQLASETALSLAYVGNKGNRLPSILAALNTLEPSQASKFGPALRDQFKPGQTSLHGVPVPYDGWIEQMTGCPPSVAQALLPYPQFCSRLQALNNEYAGQSTYHSFQMRIEKTFSSGSYLLTSYTLSKMITDSGTVKANSGEGNGFAGTFGPFERQREKAVAHDDIPHSLTVAYVYELPFGPGKAAQSSHPFINALFGGWGLSGTFRAVSGTPFWVRSGQCNVPAEFGTRCVPAQISENVYTQSKGDFDPGKGPLFSKDAFEPLTVFSQFGYNGSGPRMLPNVRMLGLWNTDVSVYKSTFITEKVKLQIRFEFFNILNKHDFAASAVRGVGAFEHDLASPNFGGWTGATTNPRNVQLGARLEF